MKTMLGASGTGMGMEFQWIALHKYSVCVTLLGWVSKLASVCWSEKEIHLIECGIVAYETDFSFRCQPKD